MKLSPVAVMTAFISSGGVLAGDAAKPELRLHVLGRLYQQEVVSAFLLPGEPLTVQSPPPHLRLEYDGETITPALPGEWTWRPPAATGLYRVEGQEGGRREARGAERLRHGAGLACRRGQTERLSHRRLSDDTPGRKGRLSKPTRVRGGHGGQRRGPSLAAPSG